MTTCFCPKGAKFSRRAALPNAPSTAQNFKIVGPCFYFSSPGQEHAHVGVPAGSGGGRDV